MASEVPVEAVSAPAATVKDPKPAQRKRKKNAPDRPQPEWMFPPDEENPVLNPKPKTEEQLRKEKEDRDASINYLHYKSVTAPMKAPPPGMLLTLVGAFLTSYGFHSASRLFTTQCKSRKKLDAWDHELGAKLPKGFPDLVKVYRDWHKEYQQASESEDTSSSSGEEDSEGSRKGKINGSKKTEKKAAQEETSSSGSSDLSDDSDFDKQTKKAKPASKPTKKAAKAVQPSASSSSSSSESDADDEKEAPGAKVDTAKPTVNGLIKNLKRKASSESSSSSSSESDASEHEPSPPAKKSKVDSAKKAAPAKDIKKEKNIPEAAAKPTVTITATKTAPTSSSSESSSSSSSSSESDSEASIKKSLPAPPKPATSSKPAKLAIPPNLSSDSSKSTDSSATLDVASTKKPSSSNTSTSSSSSDSDPSPPIKNEEAAKPVKTESEAPSKRKRSLSPHSARKAMTPNKAAKKDNAPFQRVAKDTKVDPKLASNAYVSYDYADRAHKDLSVTRGKGFTKEKNKKKRGSYRGGAIDVDGRKGIKFED